jgi:gas vesicle protein
MFTVPILGVQGSGKSSLLNAILLSDIILPVDADETTCIPTEIMYGDHSQPKAIVIFKDKTEKPVDCCEQALKQYVHQEFNPGNKMGVEKISISLNHPLLKSGVIFVDLPGVGSLTAENVKTTTEFIKKATGAIFLLRTVPPITDSEAAFIQGCWPLMANTFFVQNQWIDERKEEVEDGKAHSQHVLKKIADSCGIQVEEISIDVVGVDQALKARIKKDQNNLEKSGLMAFDQKLQNFSNDWKRELQFLIKKGMRSAINLCRQENTFQFSMTEKSVEQQRAKLEQRKLGFLAEKNAKKSEYENALIEIKIKKEEIETDINAICKTAAETFRNQVRDVIQSGVTGGEYLNRTVNDYYKAHLNQIFIDIQPKLIGFSKNIEGVVKNIGEFEFKRVTADLDVDFESKSRVHDTYSGIGGIGGAAGGAKGGAMIGTMLAPGIGTLIGGLVGSIVGGLLGSFLGKKAQKVHLDKQKEAASLALMKVVEEFKNNTVKAYRSEVDTYMKNLEATVLEWFTQSENGFDEQMKMLLENVEKYEENKQALISDLFRDRQLLENFSAALQA